MMHRILVPTIAERLVNLEKAVEPADHADHADKEDLTQILHTTQRVNSAMATTNFLISVCLPHLRANAVFRINNSLEATVPVCRD